VWMTIQDEKNGKKDAADSIKKILLNYREYSLLFFVRWWIYI
jgi:hypothetical protein